MKRLVRQCLVCGGPMRERVRRETWNRDGKPPILIPIAKCKKCGSWVDLPNKPLTDEEGGIRAMNEYEAKKARRGKVCSACSRCGSRLNRQGLCTDITCPFENHEQHCGKGWVGHREHSVRDKEKCSCFLRPNAGSEASQ